LFGQVELQGAASGFQTYMRFYEFDDSMNIISVQNLRLPGYAFIHDFAITDDSIVLMLNPLALQLKEFVLGKLSPIHCLVFDESKRLKVWLQLQGLACDS
jgi:all-trans-8'-apo-beta-carotenal 15,15'-oxygenase